MVLLVIAMWCWGCERFVLVCCIILLCLPFVLTVFGVVVIIVFFVCLVVLVCCLYLVRYEWCYVIACCFFDLFCCGCLF